MRVHLTHTKTKGQSIPIIALMIVVLFAMVGLAVDVGNTYAEQRNVVRSSNAAALSGMNALIGGGNDSSVYSAIVSSLKSNNISVAAPNTQPQPGQRVLNASYLNDSGNPVKGCETVGSCGTAIPQGVKYIQVNVSGLVDTFFARVVGRPTLPVGYDAFATRGPCATGVYPITIHNSFVNVDTGFVKPDAPYSDENYKNKTYKKVYLKDPTNPAGGFNWVRWRQETPDPSGRNPGSKEALQAMLTADGNLDQGFDEAPWPASNTLNLPKPPVYPNEPHQLNNGDWMYGNSGISGGNEVKDQLDWHIANRTVMILPIHNAEAGSGTNGTYLVSWLGAFLLRDYQLTGQGYFGLVYLGPAHDCSALVTSAPKTTNVGITAPVVFRPRSKEIPQSRPPIQYDIILDVSGSMSWTFDGLGWDGSKSVRCTGVKSKCNGPDYAWRDENQRRIFVAVRALQGFINYMGANDTMRIVTFSGNLESNYSVSNAIKELTDAWPTSGWSSDKAELQKALDKATTYKGRDFVTNGLTSSATGIDRGNQELASAPSKAPDGQTYKRVVVFITDGVANVFEDGSLPKYSDVCDTEIASCNVGYTPGGVPMPINAMGEAADKIKQGGTVVYVIALAGVDETGLKDVASAPNYPFFSTARNGADLPGILASIATNVTEGQCVPTGGNTWQSSIASENAGNVPPPQGPLSYPTVGYVYLYNESGNRVPNGTAPIAVDSQSGQLRYNFTNLAPGNYRMKAFVAYKGTDNQTRIYDQIFDPNTWIADDETSFVLKSGLGSVVAGPKLFLGMAGSTCPTS